MISKKHYFSSYLAVFFALAAFLTTQNAEAQESYHIEVDERAMAEMQERSAEMERRGEGLNGEEFVGWLLENTFLHKAGGEEVSEANFIAFLISNEGEIVERASHPVRVQPRATRISDQIDGREIGRLMERAFPGDSYFPGGTSGPFIPGDSFIPGDMFISSSDDGLALAQRSAQAAYEEKGIVGENGYGILVMAMPEQSEYEREVEVGMGLFIAWI